MLKKEDYIHIGADEVYANYKGGINLKNEIEQVYCDIEYRLKRPDLLGKTLLVSDTQFPDINRMIQKLALAMNMEVPDVYVFEDFFYGIESYGMKEYWIEISAKTIRDFNEKELIFLFARELYKIKNNVVYQTMLMDQLFKIYGTVPVVGDAMEQVSKANFNHWCRLENYTADNYAYLYCQDLSACVNAIIAMVLNSKSLAEQVDMKAFIKQASIINKLDDTVSNYTKSDEVLPYAPYRVESLLAYALSRRGMKARKEVLR